MFLLILQPFSETQTTDMYDGTQDTRSPLGNSDPSNDLSQLAHLSKIFNTALVSTKANTQANLSQEILTLTKTSAYRAILEAIQQLSLREQISEKDAAEKMVSTFRRLDLAWSEYVYQEGIRSLK